MVGGHRSGRLWETREQIAFPESQAVGRRSVALKKGTQQRAWCMGREEGHFWTVSRVKVARRQVVDGIRWDYRLREVISPNRKSLRIGSTLHAPQGIVGM